MNSRLEIILSFFPFYIKPSLQDSSNGLQSHRLHQEIIHAGQEASVPVILEDPAVIATMGISLVASIENRTLAVS